MLQNEDTYEFARYFEAEWEGIEDQWAKCHRHEAGINTNMYVEAFHNSFKYGENYLKGRRVDKCLHSLEEFAKDLCLKRLIKLEKVKCTWKTTDINKRHRTSLHLPLSFIKQNSIEIWLVKSEKSLTSETTSSDNLEYLVEKKTDCKRNCQVK